MKENVEEIITKEEIEETNENKKNIHRVDNRPGSIFSILVFAMIFIIGYLLYPQITMMLPIPGTKIEVSTQYKALSATQMFDADVIVVAVAGEEGKIKSYVSAGNEPIVFKPVQFQVVEVLKGQIDNEFVVPEYGGDALFDTNGKKEKFSVTYKNAADFEKGETYLLFIQKGEVMNGRAGALIKEKDGSFTDISGVQYTVEDLKLYLKGEKQ